MYRKVRENNKFNSFLFLFRIISMKKNALSHSNPDEYLYGRAGYLYTLMFLRQEIGEHVIDPQLITEIFEAMIKSGEKYARDTGSSSPLMYKWHDSEYMGAAHGVSGIIYLLLRVKIIIQRKKKLNSNFVRFI